MIGNDNKRLAFALVTVVVTLTTAEFYKPDYTNEIIADKEYLLKQKFIYQILYHYTQPEIKTDLYKEGQDYNVEANKDSYNDQVCVISCLLYIINKNKRDE